jgi:glycosyltransferase involved in cell wall biosynthesis
MGKKKIYHIFYNTSGNGGLYLNPIYDALKPFYEQKLFVNRYYPLKLRDFKKIFFSITERSEYNKNQWLLKLVIIRKLVRFVELKIGNKKFVSIIKKDKPDIVNYSLTNMPDAYNVLKNIRKVSPKSKIIVTCHDVSPFQSTSRIPYQKIYEYADYLLVHNKNSINILKELYGIANEKILIHPFPIIDISQLKQEKIRKNKSVPTFLFVGAMRKEKGVQCLIDAWKKLGKHFNGRLIIAGYKPKGVQLDFSSIEHFDNVELKIHSLSDEEYFDVVDISDYVVFPYTKVGNSGVLSTVVSMGKVPIASKLPTFMESEYVLDDMTYLPGNVDALVELLKKAAKEYQDKYVMQQSLVLAALNKEKAEFANMTVEAYEKIEC